MTREQIISEINKELANEFEIQESIIVPDAPLFDTLQLDSISIVDLVAILHSKYGIMIVKSELSEIETFSDLYDYIEARISK